MKNELKEIIEKLHSDYDSIKENLLCCSGPVSYAYENATDTFVDYVVKFVEDNIGNKCFFNHVLSIYKELERVNIDVESKEMINASFVINDMNIYKRCNCLKRHINVLSKTSVCEHLEKRRVLKNYGENYAHKLKWAKLNHAKSNINLLAIDKFSDPYELYDFIENNYYFEPVNIELEPEKIDFLKSHYIHYHIINALVEKYYREQPKPFYLAGVDVEKISEEYKRKNVLIKKEDEQFNKYALLSLNNNVVMNHDDYIGVVYDHRISATLTVHTSTRILKIFNHLMEENYIKKISLKPIDIQISSVGLESIERGAPLNTQIKKLPEISCFFDKTYANKLIIIHNKERNEITFEELRDDFHLEGDSIVTQVIHLKYSESNNDYFIEHLDHEYILYGLDEYQNKERNITQKGNIGKIKTFKIDNSSIPFFYRYKGAYFLFLILEEYFVNKDLLVEYFDDINNLVG